MTLFNHVLMATDLAGAERTAYPWAALIAKSCSARLTVLHVDELEASAFESIGDFTEYLGLVEAMRARRLQQLSEDFRALGVIADVVVRKGRPKKVLERYAADHGVDLIVVGKHCGSDDGGHRPLGPNISRVLHKAEVPVLVVPVYDDTDEVVSDVVPVVRKVLAPTDLGPVSRAGVIFASALSKAFGDGAKVTVAHAVDWPVLFSLLPGAPPVGLPPHGIDRLHEDADERLSALVGELADPSLVARITVGPPDKRLLETADEIDADLIIIPSSGKGAFKRLMVGSVTDRIIKRTTRPVLMLPPSFLDPE